MVGAIKKNTVDASSLNIGVENELSFIVICKSYAISHIFFGLDAREWGIKVVFIGHMNAV